MALALSLAGIACSDADEPLPVAAADVAVDTPALVVVIVVDQMRHDYLRRFESEWHDGFARLLAEGLSFEQFRHSHGLTETAPGHATLATGSVPARHGIVANAIRRPDQPGEQSIVADPEVHMLGRAATTAKGASPRALLREGVGDWLQRAHPDAVVISIAAKDRAAVLLGGKQPDLALWLTSDSHSTSSHYAESLPAWVSGYDSSARADALFGRAWLPLRAPEAYRHAQRIIDPRIQDITDSPLSVHFPHVIQAADARASRVIRWTPFADAMTLELARAAIEHEGMGSDEVPDLLLLSLSGGDYIGHRFGPDSMEMYDYYYRLDALLGEFMRFLDARVAGDCVVVLTSDHGVAELPEFSPWSTAGRFLPADEVPPLVASLADAQGIAAPQLGYSQGIDLYFEDAVDAAARAAFRMALAEQLRRHPRIADAWTSDELAGGAAHGEHGLAWLHGFHPDRSSDILLEFEPGVVVAMFGTGHGTPHDYDRHVPLLIMGLGRSGRVDTPAWSVDLAPTLAAVLRIEAPADLDGRSLLPTAGL